MKKRGFTLVEVLITVVIVAFVLVGLLQLFIYSLSMAEMAGNLTIAVCESEGKIEEIRNHGFGSIVTDYSSGGTPGNIFTFNMVDGAGRIYIDNTNSDLLEIEIVASWRNSNGRIIGEDRNLNGELDGGEDSNGNAKLDSPLELITLISIK